MSTFAQTVARWMGGRTPEACAHLLSVTPNTLRNWLAGSLPPGTRIPAIAAAMNVGETKLRQTINRERPARKHRPDRAPSGTTATVDEPHANAVLP